MILQRLSKRKIYTILIIKMYYRPKIILSLNVVFHTFAQLINYTDMKKSIFILFLAMAAITVSTSSCNKYDEGSNFTIFTAKARVVNDWNAVSAVYTSGSTSTERDATGSLIIKKDGSYTLNITVDFGWVTLSESETGTWVFNNDKTQLIATDSNGDITSYDILRLKNKEMALFETMSNGDTVRYNFDS